MEPEPMGGAMPRNGNFCVLQELEPQDVRRVAWRRIAKPLVLAGSIAALVAGCDRKPQLVLVPTQEVRVYADAEGKDFVGTSAKPLNVIALGYPDKTDYVVEVEFAGGSGFVKSGYFRLTRADDPGREAEGVEE